VKATSESKIEMVAATKDLRLFKNIMFSLCERRAFRFQSACLTNAGKVYATFQLSRATQPNN
jgi:hypothetical protein